MIEDLSAYLVGFLAIYVAVLLCYNSALAGKISVLIALLIVGFIAVFRGDVGTDTYAYQSLVRSIRDGGDGGGVEPGFVLLVSALNLLGASEVVVVRLIALIYVLSLMLFVYRADRRELLVVSLYFIPSFFYSYSMNGLRIGLAFNLLLLALQQIRRTNSLWPNAVGVLAATLHYSILIPYLYSAWTRYNLALKYAILAGVLLFVLYFVLYGQVAYVDEKLSLYSNMESPSLLSGIGYLLSMSVLICGVLFSAVPRNYKRYLLLTGVLAAFGAFLISRYSYAGLRILELFAAMFPFIVATVFTRIEREFGSPIKLALVVAGLINAVFVLRRFVLEYGIGPSPWLPYSTLF